MLQEVTEGYTRLQGITLGYGVITGGGGYTSLALHNLL